MREEIEGYVQHARRWPLNAHGIESRYATLPPEALRALAERLEIHYTRKLGSWLNIAEIELSARCGQCANRRILGLSSVRRQRWEWEQDRKDRDATVDWPFTARDARIKLKSLYLNIETIRFTSRVGYTMR